MNSAQCVKGQTRVLSFPKGFYLSTPDPWSFFKRMTLRIFRSSGWEGNTAVYHWCHPDCFPPLEHEILSICFRMKRCVMVESGAQNRADAGAVITRCNYFFLSRVLFVPLWISVTQQRTVHKQPKESEWHQHKNQSRLGAQASPPITTPHHSLLLLLLPTRRLLWTRTRSFNWISPAASVGGVWTPGAVLILSVTKTILQDDDLDFLGWQPNVTASLPAFPRGFVAGVGTRWR